MAHRWGPLVVWVTLLSACDDDDVVEAVRDGGMMDAGSRDSDAGSDRDAAADAADPMQYPDCVELKPEPLSAWCTPTACPDYATRREQLCLQKDECTSPLKCRILEHDNSCGGRSLSMTIGADNGSIRHHYDAHGILVGVEQGVSVGLCLDSAQRVIGTLRIAVHGEPCKLKTSRDLECTPHDADSGTMNDTDSGI